MTKEEQKSSLVSKGLKKLRIQGGLLDFFSFFQIRSRAPKVTVTSLPIKLRECNKSMRA